jgi:hypothetical protein
MKTSHKLISQEVGRQVRLDVNIEKALGHFAILRRARLDIAHTEGIGRVVADERVRLALLPFTPVHSSKCDPAFGPIERP